MLCDTRKQSFFGEKSPVTLDAGLFFVCRNVRKVGRVQNPTDVKPDDIPEIWLLI